MKKFTFCLTAFLLMSTTASAQYVRKVVRPNFFIPEKELNRVEKLPPFPQMEQEDMQEDIHYVIPAKPEKEKKPVASTENVAPKTVDTAANPEKVHVNFLKVNLYDQQNQPVETEQVKEVQIPSQNTPVYEEPQPQPVPSYLPVDEEKIIPTTPSAAIDADFEQTENYQNIKQEYENDLEAIAQTGKAPENKNVTEALEKMNSDDMLWVEDTTFE